ncbi:phage tail protein [Emticicia sp. 17c]|uniref:phage tail protein n=1 Tax=Emticicia sp. 17c TaxID=3127704 RepID=UPI00301DAF73
MENEYLGTIRIFTGTYAPEGYAFCHGQLLKIAQNQALFSLFGNIYGGDGIETFCLPDLRQVSPIAVGSALGLTPRNLGDTGGEETITLTQLQMPPHRHDYFASFYSQEVDSPENAFLPTYANKNTRFYATIDGADYLLPMSSSTVGPTGSNMPHDNMPPYLALNFVICINGIYPPISSEETTTEA